LSIAEKNGRVLLCCHAGCSVEEIITKLGLKMRDLFPAAKKTERWKQRATYIYRNESGTPLHRTVRLERRKGAEREKKFPQEHYENGKWIPGLGEVRLVPYRLKKVLAAKRLYIVEGEKDVKTLEKFGLVATTNPMGAGNWRPEYTPHFKDKSVVIFPDNDATGKEHAANVAAALLQVAKSVRVLELPDLPEKGDITDWVNAGGTRKKLKSLVDAAKRLDKKRLAKLKKGWSLSKKQKTTHVPFRVDEKGVFFQNDNGEAEKLAARVDVVAQTRDIDGNNWGRLLEWQDNEKREHKWAMPMDTLATDAGAVRSRLHSEGLPFLSMNRFHRERFNEYLQTAPADRYVTCVNRIGWHDRIYALPDKIFGPRNAESTIYQSKHDTAHHWTVRGTHKDWVENIGRLCIGNSRLILAVSCAFAGPLLHLLSAESGGFHLYGITSTGKTTALLVGGSVCGGGGQAGFVQTWRTTVNGLEAIAEAHNDATLFLDEISQVDPRQAGETAYMLGNGQGKARMTKETTGVRRQLIWTLSYISAGESTLAEHAASAGKQTRGGAEMRLLNIEADAGRKMGLFEHLHGAASPATFSMQLQQGAKRYYGTPFRKFLFRLTRRRKSSKLFIKKFRKLFLKSVLPDDPTGEVSRAADRFALIGAAGELATEWGLTGWGEGEAKKAAKRLFREWCDSRETSGSSDMHQAVEQVKAFLQTHKQSRFEEIGSYTSDKLMIREQAGFIRCIQDDYEYLIYPEVFRKEVCKDFPYQQVQKELFARKYLKCNPPDYTIKVRLPKQGIAQRLYCVRDALLEGND
jgi:uncharacterized protein (DUF927 family)